MKTTFFILFAIACIIYTGSPTINFKPFNISFEKPYLPFAMFFLILSISFFNIQYDKIGYKRGVKDSIDIIKQTFKDKVE